MALTALFLHIWGRPYFTWITLYRFLNMFFTINRGGTNYDLDLGQVLPPPPEPSTPVSSAGAEQTAVTESYQLSAH